MTIFSRSELKRCGDLFSFKQIGHFSSLLSFLTKVQGLPFYFLMGSDADKEGKTCTSSFRCPHTSFTFRCHFLTEHESEPRGGAGVSYPGENGGCSRLPSSQATMELFRCWFYLCCCLSVTEKYNWRKYMGEFLVHNLCIATGYCIFKAKLL